MQKQRRTPVLVTCAVLVNAVMAQSLRVEQTAKTISIYDADKLVLTYNVVSPKAPKGIDKVYERSGCLHPVCTPAGRAVTGMFPFDHPHQQGIFSAWVRTKYAGQRVDFWNLAGNTGRVLHERVVSKFENKKSVGFEVDLLHRKESKPQTDVLREHWKITAHETDGTFRCFDLNTTQTALTNKPLIISKYHYGGIVLRGPTLWLTKKDRGRRERQDAAIEPSGFKNNLGSDRVKGNQQRAKWVALWGNIDGKPVSISVLCHKDNFRAPQAARLHPTKPYFCFVPCSTDEFVISKSQPFASKYRYLVTDRMPDSKWITKQWTSWCAE